ncbi:MAG: response regulator [Pirellulaceae bacterium]
MRNENLNILIAEDDAGLASIVRFNLERAGFSATVAANGRVAWELAQRESFDIVITDHQMPEMNGQEFCQLLRSDERHAETPVIFLTGKKFEVDMTQMMEDLRVSMIMAKPFSPRALIETIRSLSQRPIPTQEGICG